MKRSLPTERLGIFVCSRAKGIPCFFRGANDRVDSPNTKASQPPERIGGCTGARTGEPICERPMTRPPDERGSPRWEAMKGGRVDSPTHYVTCTLSRPRSLDFMLDSTSDMTRKNLDLRLDLHDHHAVTTHRVIYRISSPCYLPLPLPRQRE
jgi:hypothetical protein